MVLDREWGAVCRTAESSLSRPFVMEISTEKFGARKEALEERSKAASSRLEKS